MEEQGNIESKELVLEVAGVSIAHEKREILNDINFTLAKGDLAYLIGRTGSGKSSILKTLYADLPLRSGTVQLSDFNFKNLRSKHLPQLRRNLGIIFQDFQLLSDRTIAENLTFVMKATGWKDRSKMKQRIADVLIQVGLSAHEHKMPHQLSGGEQQRVVIARALLNEPLMLLADEPTGNLDPEVSEGIHTLFKEINSRGTTILMATHNHTMVEKFPGRILECYEGKVVEINSLSERTI